MSRRSPAPASGGTRSATGRSPSALSPSRGSSRSPKDPGGSARRGTANAAAGTSGPPPRVAARRKTSPTRVGTSRIPPGARLAAAVDEAVVSRKQERNSTVTGALSRLDTVTSTPPEVHSVPTSSKRTEEDGPREIREDTARPSSSSSKDISKDTSKDMRSVGSWHGDAEGERSVVHVVSRIRPRLPKESNSKDGITVLADERTMVITDRQERARTFAVDEIIDSRQKEMGSQASVFARIGLGLVDRCVQGYNVCVLAYGHTGSGKTYTMLGNLSGLTPGARQESSGILPRFLEALNAERLEGSLGQQKYRCEFFELYQEQIKDLLTPPSENRARSCPVHVHPKFGVIIDGLHPTPVPDPASALELVHFGNQMRTVSATTMNQRSSRSHAIFRFTCETLNPDGGGLQSTVTFVDLAGREDQSVSLNRATQFKEMVSINTSLFHLTNVIMKLSDGTAQRGSLADFRNSKLTLLLSQALVGNSTTTVITTVSPLVAFVEDTVNTMTFAQKVKKIKTMPVMNKSRKDTIAELEAEIRRLRSELREVKVGPQSAVHEERNAQIVATMSLMDAYKRSESDDDELMMIRTRTRSEAVRAYGLQRKPGSTLRPFLTNLSSDPALQGICNHFIDEGSIKFGSDPDCDVVIHGVGILPLMCALSRTAGGYVRLKIPPIEDGEAVPRVLVNGVAVEAGCHKDVKNKEVVMLGYARCYRLIVPLEETNSLHELCEETEKLDLDLRTAMQEVCEEGVQFKAMRPFLKHLVSMAPANMVGNFTRALHMVCPLVDEANLITREVRSGSSLIGIRFELHALADVFDMEHDSPELVVCVVWDPGAIDRFRSGVRTVMMKAGKASGKRFMGREIDQSLDQLAGHARTPHTHELGLDDMMCINLGPGRRQQSLLYVWSLEKFLGRLAKFREFYEEGMAMDGGFESIRQRLRDAPHIDPWNECSLASIEMLVETVAQTASQGCVDGTLASSRYSRSPQTPSSPRAGTLGALEAKESVSFSSSMATSAAKAAEVNTPPCAFVSPCMAGALDAGNDGHRITWLSGDQQVPPGAPKREAFREIAEAWGRSEDAKNKLCSRTALSTSAPAVPTLPMHVVTASSPTYAGRLLRGSVPHEPVVPSNINYAQAKLLFGGRLRTSAAAPGPNTSSSPSSSSHGATPGVREPPPSAQVGGVRFPSTPGPGARHAEPLLTPSTFSFGTSAMQTALASDKADLVNISPTTFCSEPLTSVDRTSSGPTCRRSDIGSASPTRAVECSLQPRLAQQTVTLLRRDTSTGSLSEVSKFTWVTGAPGSMQSSTVSRTPTRVRSPLVRRTTSETTLDRRPKELQPAAPAGTQSENSAAWLRKTAGSQNLAKGGSLSVPAGKPVGATLAPQLPCAKSCSSNGGVVAESESSESSFAGTLRGVARQLSSVRSVGALRAATRENTPTWSETRRAAA